MARPTDYTPEIGDEICAWIAGGDSLNAFCKMDETPDRATVYRWLRVHPEFRDNYARAREDQADTHVDEIKDIADDGTNDWMEKHGKDGENLGWQLNGEHVQRSKLRIDARKWIASKLKSKNYGDKIEHSTDPDKPIKHDHTMTVQFIRPNADPNTGGV